MTLENTPDLTTDAPNPTGEQLPAKAPRRRATRKTAAPVVAAPAAPAAEAVPVDPLPAAAVPVDPLPADAVPADAPVRAARRTAVKKAPAKRASSSRATKKTVAAVEPEPDSAVVPEQETAAETAPAPSRASAATFDVFAELAAAKAPRRAVRKARVVREPAVTAPTVREPTVTAPTAPEPTVTAPTAPEPTVDEPIVVEPAPEVSSSTALLFQAADPTARPRRRRAQSPAGPPRVAEEAPVVAATHRDVEPVTPDRETIETEVGTPVKRTSRRRGSARAADAAEEVVAVAAQHGPQATDPGPGQDGEDEAAHAQASDDSAEDDDAGDEGGPRRRRRRGGRGRRGRNGSDGPGSDHDGSDHDGSDHDGSGHEGRAETAGTPPDAVVAGHSDDEPGEGDAEEPVDGDEGSGSSRRRRRRRRSGRGGDGADSEPAQPSRGRSGRSGSGGGSNSGSNSNVGAVGADEVTALRGSTRLEAKRQRRREGRDAGRRRTIVTESEFLARRESVDRSMVVREIDGATQIAVMEDGVLVEHYVSRQAQASMAGNVYLGRVQNVLPSMEAAFVDVGKGRNAVLYAGEVNWDAAGLEGQPRRIEQALKSGDSVLVQVTKDPIGQKGARLTSQVTLAGRYLVYVPGGGMTGISRKLPDNERARLKKLLREIVPDSAGVIVRTAAEGASEDELRADIARLQAQWTAIEKKAKSASSPALLQGEPDLAIRVVRDIFNGDFGSLVVSGDEAWDTISGYIGALAPDLAEKVSRWTGTGDVFSAHRVDEQLAKGMDRKVWLPSGGSLVIDRTEAMTVVDVNTGKFTGAGGTLEETVTRNNLEAAEEIVRQLRLRDIGGIIVIDFIDMVLESNRDLVLRRLVECLGRDRTKHQVAEVTSLGLVQMTRKRVGQGLVEAFSETCEHCMGRGFIVHTDPVEKHGHSDEGSQGGHAQGGHPHGSAPEQSASGDGDGASKAGRRKRGGAKEPLVLAGTIPLPAAVPVLPEDRAAVKATLATIAAAAAHAHDTAQAGLATQPALTTQPGRAGRSGPADLPLGFTEGEALELFPVAPEIFSAVDRDGDGDADHGPVAEG